MLLEFMGCCLGSAMQLLRYSRWSLGVLEFMGCFLGHCYAVSMVFRWLLWRCEVVSWDSAVARVCW